MLRGCVTFLSERIRAAAHPLCAVIRPVCLDLGGKWSYRGVFAVRRPVVVSHSGWVRVP
jgi:hypothetical protein